jgi:Flp pilus assembly protein TadG
MLKRFRRERGQDLAEYAVVMPVLLVLIFGIAQFALVMLAYSTVGDAARQGARTGLVGDNADYPDRIRAAVYKVTDAAGLPRARLTVTPVKAGTTIVVTVTYNMQLIVSFFGPTSVTLRAVSTKLIEVQ